MIVKLSGVAKEAGRKGWTAPDVHQEGQQIGVIRDIEHLTTSGGGKIAIRPRAPITHAIHCCCAVRVL